MTINGPSIHMAFQVLPVSIESSVLYVNMTDERGVVLVVCLDVSPCRRYIGVVMTETGVCRWEEVVADVVLVSLIFP